MTLRLRPTPLIVGPIIKLVTSPEQYHKLYTRLAGKDSKPWVEDGAGATLTVLVNDVGELCTIVAMHPVSSLVNAYSILVHEAVHVWQAYIDHIGETKPSEEFMAYSIQAISKELMNQYNDLQP